MKTRVATAVILFAIHMFVFVFCETIVLNIYIALVSSIAALEFYQSAKFEKQYEFLALSVAYSIVFAFVDINLLLFVSQGYLLLLVLAVLLRYKTSLSANTAFLFTMSSLFTWSMRIFINVKDTEPGVVIVYILILFGGCWFADIFAYLFGTLLGKKKLCPTISPKKTVAGAIAGLVLTPVAIVSMMLIFVNVTGSDLVFNYPLLAVLSVILAAVGMTGDLIASIIKRQHGLKDFGGILPGHGGIMDRYDSALFTIPVGYFLIQILNIF